nr:MAG TPA: hypothetical protein [Caudoviricetes sp.]
MNNPPFSSAFFALFVVNLGGVCLVFFSSKSPNVQICYI